MKWAAIIDHAPITRDEAKRLVRRAFQIPNAKQLRLENLQKELVTFASHMMPRFACAAFTAERVIRRITAADVERDARLWESLRWLHEQVRWNDRALATSTSWFTRWEQRVTVNPLDDLVELYRECKQRGLWSIGILQEAREHARSVAMTRRLARVNATLTAQQEQACPSRRSQIQKTPVSSVRQSKQPVPAPVKKSPV